MPDPTIDTDILIIGAGPAGMAAACAATACRIAPDTDSTHGQLSVTVLDDNPLPGGQIWRGGPAHADSAAGPWFRQFAASGAQLLSGASVVAPLAPNLLLINHAGQPRHVQYKKLILATGARELFLPFPGWTLPGVTGVGGLSALAKGGVPVRGKRIIFAGTGPLLLAAAEHLKSMGASVVLIAEQTSFTKLAKFGAGLISTPSKFWQAISLKSKLLGVPFKTNSYVTHAHRSGDALRVTLQIGGKTKTLDCDYLGCAYGLIANTELPRLLGCAITPEGFVQSDELQRTSQPDIYVAGEITGIGGVDKSIAEGLVAGTDVARTLLLFRYPSEKFADPRAATTHFMAALAARKFVPRLAQAFALRPELRQLAAADTIICRCEDIRLDQISACSSARDAKLQTRCGMGACQGRICGAALREIRGWTDASVRPPVFSSPLQTLLPLESANLPRNA